MNHDAQKLLDDYQMGIQANQLIKELTIAQQQMVEIVKAISYNSKILVMDEPTSSISDKEVAFLFKTMRSLTSKGVGIIYISHKMSELEEICDRVTVMRDGEYVGTEVVKNTTKDALIAMMVGRELTNYYTRDFEEHEEVIMRCEGISDGELAENVSFELRKGEILGFAAGETVQIVENQVYINGKKLEEDYKTTKIDTAGIAGEKLKLGGDEYFVLGDNRKNSEDSRSADIGKVKRSYIYGKAWFVASPKKDWGFVK